MDSTCNYDIEYGNHSNYVTHINIFHIVVNCAVIVMVARISDCGCICVLIGRVMYREVSLSVIRPSVCRTDMRVELGVCQPQSVDPNLKMVKILQSPLCTSSLHGPGNYNKQN